jgi:hypothetical protein
MAGGVVGWSLVSVATEENACVMINHSFCLILVGKPEITAELCEFMHERHFSKVATQIRGDRSPISYGAPPATSAWQVAFTIACVKATPVLGLVPAPWAILLQMRPVCPPVPWE